MAIAFKFYLDDTEIDEPQGWDSYQSEVTRDETFHGIAFESSVDSLDFYGTGFDYIEEIKQTQGLKASVNFSVYQNCDGGPDDYEVIISGKLNMGKYAKHCGESCYVSVPIDPEGCEISFTNRFNQSVDVDKMVSQNGYGPLTAYPKLGFNIELPAKALDYLSYGQVDQAAGDDEPVIFPDPGGGHEAWVLVRPEYADEIDTNINDTHLTGGTNAGYNGPSGIFIPMSNQVLFNEANIKCFNQPIHITGRIKGTITMPGVNPMEVYAIFRKGELANDDPFVSPDMIEYVFIGSLANADHYPFDFTITPYDWSPKNTGTDGIYLYLYMHQRPGATFNGNVHFDPETFIKLETVKECPPTSVQAYMIHETLSRVVENITDFCMRVKSSYYGRTDSLPFSFDEDGCGSLRMVTSGLKVRQAPPPANTFFISPSDLINGLCAIDNVGMGIEPDVTLPGNSVLRIEDLDFFYEDKEILQCLSIQNATFAIEEQRDYSIVKCGYKKWTTLANFGLDEINSDREFHLAIDTLNNTLDITCVLVGGEYALEVTRQQSFVDSNSADTAYDDETFIVCLKRSGYAGFIVEQGGIMNPQNIFNPLSNYNYRISPLRNLLRWYRSLINAYPNITDATNKLFFSSGTGNIFASGQLADGYGYGQSFCKMEGVDIVENMDVFTTVFNDVARFMPLWANETISFDYPMSIADYNKIKANRYGYISYQCGNGNISQGWIKTITYTPAQGMASFVLRQRWGK